MPNKKHVVSVRLHKKGQNVDREQRTFYTTSKKTIKSELHWKITPETINIK